MYNKQKIEELSKYHFNKHYQYESMKEYLSIDINDRINAKATMTNSILKHDTFRKILWRYGTGWFNIEMKNYYDRNWKLV